MADTTATHVIHAAAQWQAIGVVSDLHLQAAAPQTAAAWHAFLKQASPTTGIDALFILGDLFELWVGDDALDATPDLSPETPFWRDCVAALADASTRLPVYLALGNRDFLIGERFCDATGIFALPMHTVLDWGARRYLLAHGDAWCTSDTAYQDFRATSRTPQWQRAFLSQTLEARLRLAAQMRAQSQAHQAAQTMWVDVEPAAVAEDTSSVGATDVIHGHTHRPADHALSSSGERIVLSDWDAQATPPRLEWLRVDANGHTRVALTAST